MSAIFILLLWIALFTVWYWFVKPDLAKIVSENQSPIVSLGISALFAKIGVSKEQATGYVMGVLGIIIFFVVGVLVA